MSTLRGYHRDAAQENGVKAQAHSIERLKQL
jgi:hypothetical protein